MFSAMNSNSAPSGPVEVPKSKPSSEKPRDQVVKPKRPDPLKDKYRDRAEERRQRGEGEDDEESGPLDADALRERRERSKYLGGSEETTHLVEGLDIMLYERRKLEIELEEQRRRQMEAQPSETTFLGAKQLVIDQYGHAKAVEAPQNFATPLGRGIFNALFQREVRPNVSSFLPGRTTYSFSLDPDSTQELPMIIERNMLSDADEHTDRDIRLQPFSAQISPVALNKLSVAMSYLKQGEHGIKKRQQERQEQEMRAKTVVKETIKKLIEPVSKPIPVAEINEDEEDIFGDVRGTEYTPTVKGPQQSQEEAVRAKWDAVRSEGNDGRSIGDVSAKRPRDEMSHRTGESAKMDESVDDEYAGFDSGSDDEDIFAMDTGVKLKRADFATDEEWVKYTESREAIPKSAFQFGVKSGDGRRKQQRGKPKKAKLYQFMYKSVSGSIGFDPHSKA
jgi:IK cytokine